MPTRKKDRAPPAHAGSEGTPEIAGGAPSPTDQLAYKPNRRRTDRDAALDTTASPGLDETDK